MRRLFALVVVAAALSSCCRAPRDAGSPSIPADGSTDVTVAIQRALDAAAVKGGEVVLPAGQYLVLGSLTIPSGVTLRGSWDAPHHGDEWNKGTTLLVTANRDNENGNASVTMLHDSALNGVTFAWPAQKWDDIHAYPWTVRSTGQHVTVENVTLVNAYQGICLGGPDSSLHLLRNVFGCVLRRGVFVDHCYDIGRIENVHFNPHYWLASHYPPDFHDTATIEKTVHDYVTANLEAFIFGRTDWEYSFDTFVWGAKAGYRFIKTDKGACDGQFLGMGADNCQACVLVDALQPVGLQITGGQFTSFAGGPGTAIVTSPSAGGAVQVVNSTFYATTSHAVWMKGDTQVTLSGCHILESPAGGAVLAEHGRLIVQGCAFDQPGPAIVLQKEVAAAAITGNLQPGGLQVRNGIGPHAQIGLNETP